jgi:flagellar biosynthetic protein FlhB
MAEDLGDKTEAPTPRRRMEAREEGNVARSPDLVAALVVLSILLMLKWWGPRLTLAMQALMREMLGSAALSELSADSVHATALSCIRAVCLAIAPILIGVMVVAVLGNVIQVGLIFNSKRLRPNLGALNPFKGVNRLLGGGNGIVQLLMNITKMLMVAAVGYSAIHGRLQQIVGAQQLTFLQIFGMGAGIVYSIVVRITVLLLVLAIIDYAWQRVRLERQLRMTKQEVKEEMRRMEGDPKIKQRRRQVALQMLTQRFKKDVPTADVVVTNPTEFAVALKYDQSEMHAPRVIAKGQGYLAMKIREIAVAHGVPILERKPLARALYRLVDVGQEIPEQFYSAVAEILAYVYELSGKVRSRKTA